MPMMMAAMYTTTNYQMAIGMSSLYRKVLHYREDSFLFSKNKERLGVSAKSDNVGQNTRRMVFLNLVPKVVVESLVGSDGPLDLTNGITCLGACLYGSTLRTNLMSQ